MQNRQDQKEAFLKGGTTETRNSGNLTMPASPYQVMAGTVVAGALVTGIKSDLPGDVIATVTEPVYDTATGKFLLIPQGSRILGKYNSQVSYGQSRVQVVWNRIILPIRPRSRSTTLVGTDPAGYAGLEDDVDWHWDRIFAGAVADHAAGRAAPSWPRREPPGRRPHHHRRGATAPGQRRSGRPGDDPAQPGHPADADGLGRACRFASSSTAIWCCGRTSRCSSTGGLHDDDAQAAARAAAQDRESVKLTFACPASLKADLDRYAALHAQTYGEAVDADEADPHMLEAFMAGIGDSGRGARARPRRRSRADEAGFPGSHPSNAQPKAARSSSGGRRAASGYDGETRPSRLLAIVPRCSALRLSTATLLCGS